MATHLAPRCTGPARTALSSTLGPVISSTPAVCAPSGVRSPECGVSRRRPSVTKRRLLAHAASKIKLASHQQGVVLLGGGEEEGRQGQRGVHIACNIERF